MKRQSSRRGVAMLAVLVALLLLSMLAGSFFLQSRDSGSLASVTMAQTVASNNAELGLAEAVRVLRDPGVNVTTINTCTTADVDNGTCATMDSGLVSGTGTDLANGGGLRYRYIVYKLPFSPTDPRYLPDSMYVVRVTGFYGHNINASNVVTSIIESEVEIAKRVAKTTCVGGYDCSGS